MNACRTIDLVVVGDKSCTTTRTYLEYLKRNQFQPAILVLVDFTYQSAKRAFVKKAIRLFDPKRKIFPFARPMQRNPIFFDLCNIFQKVFDFQVDLFSEKFNYENYADTVIDYKAKDFSELKLHKLLLGLGRNYFLYTSGGMVPGSLLSNSAFKMLHIHPGIVPQVQGSDGLLWSILTRQKVGMSCFFMDAGIDTGDLIIQREYEFHQFPELKYLVEDHVETLVSALIYSYDRHFRAKLLIEALDAVEGNLSRITAKKQPAEGRRVYYGMHSRLMQKVLQDYICATPSPSVTNATQNTREVTT